MNNPNNISTGKVLKKLLYFVKPHSFWLGVSVAGAVASMALDILMANVLRILTDTAIYGQREGLIRSLYYMAFVIISGIFVSFTNKYSSGRFCLYAAKDIREAASRHMERLTMSYMENNNSGEAVSRLTNNVATVQNFLENNFINIIYMPLVTIGGLTYLFILNWKLLLFSCALIPVAGIFAGILSKPVGKYSKQLQEQLGKINSLVQDAIGGISMLKAFNLNKVLLVKYKENVDASLDIALKIELRNAMMAPAKTVLNIAPFVLCIIYGGYLSVRGQLTPGELIAFINLLGNAIVHSISTMPSLVSSFREMTGAAAHLFEVFDQPVERADGSSTADLSELPVQFKEVSFCYGAGKTILQGMNFDVKPGATVALVGPSGCGKTTIFKLVCGFYEPEEGDIKLFGKSTRSWNLNALRTHIALVSQDTYLFPATIAENIAYGKAGVSQEEIEEAAKTANAHEFIMELPQGYNTVVGERGARLSGGQRQRIAIARAVLKDAALILLDEPTSALDTQSEMYVQETLSKFTRGRTVMVIAHRLSTIKEADIVLVMDEGRIVEKGSHNELMEGNGLYRQLYLKQFISQDATKAREEEEGA